MESIIDRAYRVVRFFIDVIIANGAAIVLLAATVLALVEIVRRYLFGLVYEWGQDAVTYLIVGAVFLFFATAQARRSHLAMTAAVDVMRARGMTKLVLACRAVVTLVSLLMFSGFVWWGIPTVERTMLMGRTTQSQMMLLWPFQACLLAGFALMAVTALFQLYQDVQALRGKTAFPWSPVEEGFEI